MARKRKKDKASIGLLFWTAFVLFTVVVFLSNRSSIYDVLERTELIAVLERSVKRAVDNTIGRGAQPVADRYDYQDPKYDEDTKPISPEVSAPAQEQPSGSPPPRGLAPIGEREIAGGRQEAPVPDRDPAAAPGAEPPVATIDERDDAGPRLSFAEQNRRRIFSSTSPKRATLPYAGCSAPSRMPARRSRQRWPPCLRVPIPWK